MYAWKIKTLIISLCLCINSKGLAHAQYSLFEEMQTFLANQTSEALRQGESHFLIFLTGYSDPAPNLMTQILQMETAVMLTAKERQLAAQRDAEIREHVKLTTQLELNTKQISGLQKIAKEKDERKVTPQHDAHKEDEKSQLERENIENERLIAMLKSDTAIKAERKLEEYGTPIKLKLRLNGCVYNADQGILECTIPTTFESKKERFGDIREPRAQVFRWLELKNSRLWPDPPPAPRGISLKLYISDPEKARAFKGSLIMRDNMVLIVGKASIRRQYDKPLLYRRVSESPWNYVVDLHQIDKIELVGTNGFSSMGNLRSLDLRTLDIRWELTQFAKN